MKNADLRWAVEAAQNLGRQFWEVRAAKDKPKAGELLIYGPIWGTSFYDDEVSPKQIRKALEGLGEIDTLSVFINSPGGSVFAGQAIHAILRRHPAQTLVYIDGLAASAASVIAMAGDRVIMPKNAMLMIHNAWTIALGDAKELRKTADTLDQIQKAMLAVYQEKTKLSEAKIVELLDAETWMTAQEAVDMGFADEIEESKAVAASADGDFLVFNGERVDMNLFRNPPKLPESARSPDTPPPPPTPLTGATAEQLDQLHGQGLITHNEWANGRRALAGLPPLPDPPPEPNTPPTPERQTPLSLYAFRQRVNANQRRMTR